MTYRAKRLFSSVTHVFEGFIDRVENHEAVANSLLREVAAGAAKLNVERVRLEQEIHQLSQEQDRLEKISNRWASRAKAISDSDERRALGCVAEMKKANMRLARVHDQRLNHVELCEQVYADLEQVELRLTELKTKRTSLSARSARAKAMAASEHAAQHASGDALQRWEMAVVADEYLVSGLARDCEGSVLAREFTDAEEEAELRELLAQLTSAGEDPHEEGASDVVK